MDGSNVYTRAAAGRPLPGLAAGRACGTGEPVDLWAITNHFSSTPDARVGQRTEQAAYVAAIVTALRTRARACGRRVGGDLNVFPRPDDPFAPAPSDQLGPLYEAGLENLWDDLADEVPAAAYTYVFEGQAQTLDHQFVTTRARRRAGRVRVAHVNADWPADHEGDGARGASDHDPVVARFDLPATLAQLQDLLAYYASVRLIDAKTAGQLRSHLDKAAERLAAGNRTASDPSSRRSSARCATSSVRG